MRFTPPADAAAPLSAPSQILIIEDRLKDCTGPLPSGRITNRTVLPEGRPISIAEIMKQNEEKQCQQFTSGGKIFVNNTDCYACSVDSTGEGNPVTGACNVSDKCTGSDANQILLNMVYPSSAEISTPQSRRNQTVHLPGIGPAAEVEHVSDSVLIIRAEIIMYCQKDELKGDISHVNQGCVKTKVIKAAIRELIPLEGYQLAVSSTAIDEDFRDMVDPLYYKRKLHQMPSSKRMLQTCGAWARYNVYITSIREHVYKLVESEWKDLVNSTNTDFRDKVQELQEKFNLDDSSIGNPTVLCELKTHTKESFHLPTKTIQPYDLFGISIGPTVSITGEQDIINPDALIRLSPYNISLSNFPNSAINVMLVSVNNSIMVDVGPVIKVFEPQDLPVGQQQRVLRAEWTPSQLPGRYYLKAFLSINPLFASYSSIFHLDAPSV